MTQDGRQTVQERKILRSESRWLQQALFALSKAEDDRAKLAKVSEEELEPVIVTIEGAPHGIEAVTSAVKDAVLERVELLRSTSDEGRAFTR